MDNKEKKDNAEGWHVITLAWVKMLPRGSDKVSWCGMARDRSMA